MTTRPRRRKIDVCPGGWGDLVDVLGNQTHIGFLALQGLERSNKGPRSRERIRILHDVLEQLNLVRDRIRLCPRRQCNHECESARFVDRLLGVGEL